MDWKYKVRFSRTSAAILGTMQNALERRIRGTIAALALDGLERISDLVFCLVEDADGRTWSCWFNKIENVLEVEAPTLGDEVETPLGFPVRIPQREE